MSWFSRRPAKKVLVRKAQTLLSLERLEDRLHPAAGVREQYMLELVNRMRENPAGELPLLLNSNDADVNNALTYFHVNRTTLQSQWDTLTAVPPLAWNDTIAAVALNYSNTMALLNQQSHTLNGTDPGSRLTAGGYPWSAYGENIYGYATSVFQAHAGFAIDWGPTASGIQSPPGHRENIMSSNFREMGIGIVDDSSPGFGPLVVVQDFGNTFNFGNSYLLGTAYNDLNANNYYDMGEGLANVAISVTNGLSTYTTTTSAAGGYQLQLPAGIYTVTASGGQLAAQQTFNVTLGSDNVHRNVIGNLAPNILPVFAPIADQDLQPTDTTASIPLSATDADGGTLSYSAILIRAGQAYDLDNQLGLTFTGSYNQNMKGANEKWMKSSVNGAFYFILPSGEFRKWSGQAGDLMASSASVATFDPTFWLNPALLHDATTRSLPNVGLQILSGNQLKLSLPTGFYGQFAVKANVFDGRDTVSQTFFVNREAPTATKIVSSLPSGAYGQPVTFTVSVTSPAGNPPSGQVSLTATNVNTSSVIELGSGNVNTSGQFVVSLSTLPPGTYSLNANFAGIGNYQASAATSVSYTVVQGVSVTRLLANPASGLLYGQGVTLTP